MRGMLCASMLVATLVARPAAGQEDQPPITVPPAPATQPAPPPPPRPAPIAHDREEPRRPPPFAAPAPAAPDLPVVRAVGGNMGMFFRFGGLANLFATGNSRNVVSTAAADALVVTQVGLKFVTSEHWMFPIYIGAGLRVVSSDVSSPIGPSTSTTRTDWGLDLGAGFEHHFRIWRRISPFVGLNLGLGFADPTGDENLLFGIGFGPSLGVEYYIGDRLSLTALYQMVLQVAYQQASSGTTASASVTAFSFSTLAGGAMNLTYYF